MMGPLIALLLAIVGGFVLGVNAAAQVNAYVALRKTKRQIHQAPEREPVRTLNFD